MFVDKHEYELMKNSLIDFDFAKASARTGEIVYVGEGVVLMSSEKLVDFIKSAEAAVDSKDKKIDEILTKVRRIYNHLGVTAL